MKCPYCKEQMQPNQIECGNCDQYLPTHSVQFQAIKPRRAILHPFINTVGGIIFLFGAIFLISIAVMYIPPLIYAIIPLLLGALIIAMNNSSSYFDCPNCRAEKSILAKPKMIKSHCKYCHTSYNFIQHDK